MQQNLANRAAQVLANWGRNNRDNDTLQKDGADGDHESIAEGLRRRTLRRPIRRQRQVAMPSAVAIAKSFLVH
ncbi:unnamed protein product [Dibothriocephalus latus]|uniref:Uncharacterized protein n=1 Tax=Dibothriocephalus latus TaxID=60516 RepID=A0A3P7PCG3_DIBLA|nr:unnamed protein product [Dibothriocephalus latus]